MKKLLLLLTLLIQLDVHTQTPTFTVDHNNCKFDIDLSGSILSNFEAPKSIVGEDFPFAFGDINIAITGFTRPGSFKGAFSYQNNLLSDNSNFQAGVKNSNNSLVYSSGFDQYFYISKSEIASHINNINEAIKTGIPYEAEDLPNQVRDWPAYGNPHIEIDSSFEHQFFGAAFFDYNNNGIYDPLLGDYPSIATGFNLDSAPEHIYLRFLCTDNTANAIPFNLQLYSFTFDDNNLNTFYHQVRSFHLGNEDLIDYKFSLIIDPQGLGCVDNQYVGFKENKNMVYFYKKPSNLCLPAASFYAKKNYAFGLSMHNMHYEDSIKSFVVTDETNPFHTQNDLVFPTTLENFVSITGGNQYVPEVDIIDPTTLEKTSFMYNGDPNSEDWNLCGSNGLSDSHIFLTMERENFIIGASNLFTFSTFATPLENEDCASIDPLIYQSNVNQRNFDALNLFLHKSSVDAPDLVLGQVNTKPEIEFEIMYDNLSSNNYNLEYESLACNVNGIDSIDDRFRFEGFAVYQMKNDSTKFDIAGSEELKLVYQCDIENDFIDGIRWNYYLDSSDHIQKIFYPENLIKANNLGINDTFNIDKDYFSLSQDSTLKQGQTYYYTIIAYAANNWSPFDTTINYGAANTINWSIRNRKVYEITIDLENSTNNQFKIMDIPNGTQIEVFNLMGNLLYSSEVSENNFNLKHHLNSSAVPNGIYIINLSKDNLQSSTKLALFR